MRGAAGVWPRREPPGSGRAAPQDQSAHRPREHRCSGRRRAVSSNTAPSRSPRSGAPHAGRSDPQHAGRRPRRGPRRGEWRRCSERSARAAWSSPTTTPCSPARRASATTRSRTACFALAERQRLPVVLFAEGGGGRPGDTDSLGVAGLDVPTFAQFAKLSGLVPLIGIVSGRCFAGNAALLGCCDVIIATRDANIGMGGPAMIEGGGLGVYRPEEVGPVGVQAPNGVIDILVEDEIDAVRGGETLPLLFPGTRSRTGARPTSASCAAPSRKTGCASTTSATSSRRWPTKARCSSCARPSASESSPRLIRIEGRPFGLIANNPKHLGGAIDSDAADKAARFMQLCDAFDLPIVSLCDTPGFMVGPEAEKTALVRHVSRMFVTAANLDVPVLHRGAAQGLRARRAGHGRRRVPRAVLHRLLADRRVRRHGPRRRRAARLPQGARGDRGHGGARQALPARWWRASYETGKAINIASVLEIDQVIDPVDTRRWIIRGLDSCPAPRPRDSPKRPFVDTW